YRIDRRRRRGAAEAKRKRMQYAFGGQRAPKAVEPESRRPQEHRRQRQIDDAEPETEPESRQGRSRRASALVHRASAELRSDGRIGDNGVHGVRWYKRSKTPPSAKNFACAVFQPPKSAIVTSSVAANSPGCRAATSGSTGREWCCAMISCAFDVYRKRRYASA